MGNSNHGDCSSSTSKTAGRSSSSTDNDVRPKMTTTNPTPTPTPTHSAVGGGGGAAGAVGAGSSTDLQSRVDELMKQLGAAHEEISALRGGSGGGEKGGDPATTTEASGVVSVDTADSDDSVTTVAKQAFTSAHGGGGGGGGEKSGYLFKWQDRSIGWGGTKWDLRYVSLERGRLAYRRAHTDAAPRYVLTLRRCAVRDDGYKLNKRHVSHTKKKKGGDGDGDGDGGDDQQPDIDEVGAYYHVFSVYQRPSDPLSGASAHGAAEDDDETRIIPLLRFSTPSLAEKVQWLELLSEACAYCDSDVFAADESAHEAERRKMAAQPLPPAGLGDVHVTQHQKGTLPPLIFGEAAPPPPRRFPSRATMANMSAGSYRKKSGSKDAARSNIAAYPPSKPMHRESGPSYLSDEAPTQNFRGLFNLALIVLVVSNFRLVLETVRQHGFVLERIFHPDFTLEHFREAPLTDFPALSGWALLLTFLVYAYVLETMLARGTLNERFGMTLHYLNANAALVVPLLIVWHFIPNPFMGGALLMHAAITWMKLLSYVHANEDYRTHREIDSYRQTLALINDLDDDARDIAYPQNVTLNNLFYFWCAPTLTYQIAFPRSPRIRKGKLLGILFRLVVAVAFFLFLIAQIVSPNLDRMMQELEESGDGVFSPHIMADYLLKLSIANTYIWLLIFYIFFHLYLNLCAEVLRFGDRVFYKDWWNSSELSAYWRLWNQPVHYWLVRHVYFPCVRVGMGKTAATFVVFFVSAVMHEVLISVPFHMIRAWSFLGMMGQIPLVALTKYLDRRMPGSSVGNVIFWCSFCVVGQPMAILLYSIDYWKMTRGCGEGGGNAAVGDCPSGWGGVSSSDEL